MDLFSSKRDRRSLVMLMAGTVVITVFVVQYTVKRYTVPLQSSLIESCGDGKINMTGEECDDGNNAPEDGCGPTCKIEFCGDGIAQEDLNEECDSGYVCTKDGAFTATGVAIVGVSCRKDTDSDCHKCIELLGGNKRCGGDTAGKICQSDADCTANSPFTCEFNAPQEPACGPDCIKLPDLNAPVNLCSGIAGYWPLDETPGFAIVDRSGYNFHGVVTSDNGSPIRSDGPSVGFNNSGALIFPNAGHTIDLKDIFTRNDSITYPGGEFTFSTWLQRNEGGSGVLLERYVIDPGDIVGNVHKNIYQISISASGAVRVALGYNLAQAEHPTWPLWRSVYTTADNVFIASTDWKHISITVRQFGVAVYINGVQSPGQFIIGEAGLPGVPPIVDPRGFSSTFVPDENSAPLRTPEELVDVQTNMMKGWQGGFDDIRIYRRGLNANEIRTLAQKKPEAYCSAEELALVNISTPLPVTQKPAAPPSGTCGIKVDELQYDEWEIIEGALPGPIGRKHRMAVVGDYVYIFGGYYNNNMPTSDIIWRAPVSNPVAWEDTGKKLPERVRGGPVAVIGDYVYMFGAYTTGKTNDDIWRAPVSDPTSWSDAGRNLPGPVYDAQFHVINDTMYLFAGNDFLQNYIYSASVSDPLDWADTGRKLFADVMQTQTAIIGDYIYIFGGNTGSTVISNIYRAPISSPMDWEDTDAKLPARVNVSTLLVVGDYVYLFGGYNGQGAYLGTIFRAPVDNPLSWEDTSAQLPTRLFNSAGLVIGDYAYLFGGYETSDLGGLGYTDSIFRASITTGEKCIGAENPAAPVVVIDDPITQEQIEELGGQPASEEEYEEQYTDLIDQDFYEEQEVDNSEGLCGDRVRNLGEECDLGIKNSDVEPNMCRTNCTFPHCGDRIIDAGEQCDNGSVCSHNPSIICLEDADCRTCRFINNEPRCGGDPDGKECRSNADCADVDYTCNYDTIDPGCSTACRLTGIEASSSSQEAEEEEEEVICGDGIRAGAEECDDGRLNSDIAADACRTDCTLPRCGDFVIDEFEECDQGVGNNNEQPNRCRTNCRFPYCGDGVVDNGEECDFLVNSRCTNTCTLRTQVAGARETKQPSQPQPSELVALHQAAEKSEQLVLTVNISSEAQQSVSSVPIIRIPLSVCGDGTMELSEECDDGNTTDGDGCNRYCRDETVVLAAANTSSSSIAVQPATPIPQPLQIPLAQLQPLAQAQPQTGPAIFVAIAAGAAGGVSWIRRRKRANY